MLPCLRPAALMLRVFPDQRRASTTQAYEREHVGFAGAKLSQFRSEPQANGKSRIQANANGGLAAFRPGLIPLPHHIERTIYGKDVMDLTIFGLRSM
jgi:hypothetical protein